jgi:hypothetical protein
MVSAAAARADGLPVTVAADPGVINHYAGGHPADARYCMQRQNRFGVVPADGETIAVCRLGSQPGRRALVDR